MMLDISGQISKDQLMDKQELLRILAQEASSRRYAKDEVIVQEGAPATEGLALLLAGETKVVQCQGTARVLLGYIKVGQFFGETALMLQRPRSASVIATADNTVVLFVQAHTFKTLAFKNFLFLELLIKHTVARIDFVLSALGRQNLSQALTVDPSLEPLIQENRFQCLKLTELLNHARSTWAGVGKPIFRQGERCDNNLYIVMKGKVGAYREDHNQRQLLFQLNPGDIFGFSRKVPGSLQRYTAEAMDDAARIITFDEELVGRLMRMNQDLFYYVFRTMIAQLLMLDDGLRKVCASQHASPGDPRLEAAILADLGRGAENRPKQSALSPLAPSGTVIATSHPHPDEPDPLQVNI
jgi:CRP-like cAMP-binding protein